MSTFSHLVKMGSGGSGISVALCIWILQPEKSVFKKKKCWHWWCFCRLSIGDYVDNVWIATIVYFDDHEIGFVTYFYAGWDCSIPRLPWTRVEGDVILFQIVVIKKSQFTKNDFRVCVCFIAQRNNYTNYYHCKYDVLYYVGIIISNYTNHKTYIAFYIIRA